MVHSQMVILAGLMAYGVAGAAFLALWGFSAKDFLRMARKTNPHIDATAPADLALVCSLLWGVVLALWPLAALVAALECLANRPYWVTA